jgi:alpha-amylase
MPRFYLGLAIHNHQPVGNADHVFESVYKQAYLPFLEALERHPRIRLSLHYSGCLLDWLREHKPDFLARLKALIGRGQVEMMTGGYYEPILPAIPDADKVGQVVHMSSIIRDEMGASPKGLWLAERVWEPHLPRFLAEAGVAWTVVDDSHFKMVGLADDELRGYYLSEEEGQTVGIFPSLKLLRYIIPWHTVDEVIETFRTWSEESSDAIAVMGDDGEKFGAWPETYEHCWGEDGWMGDFFAALEANSSWLITTPLGEYAARFPPRGRIYLPTASYEEMMAWALPAGASHRFEHIKHQLEEEGRQDVMDLVRGGFWRHFLVKYPEVNNLHKKMLRVHRKVYRPGADASEKRPDAQALAELWRGECNCPYWHGVFGGIYLMGIRLANYHHLIRAEAAADAAVHGDGPWLAWEAADFDMDGREELLVDGSSANLYFAPSDGGTLFEWDVREPALNLTAVLGRRPEAYHQTLLEVGDAPPPEGEGGAKTIHQGVRMKEPGLDKRLYYDHHRRSCLRDHFLAHKTSLDDLIRSFYEELGDFADGAYASEAREDEGRIVVTLQRDGQVGGVPCRLEKEVTLAAGGSGVDVTWRLANGGGSTIDCLFASEWNLALHAGDSITFGEAAAQALGEAHTVDIVRAFALEGHYPPLRLRAELVQPAALWPYPIEAVSNSEGGFELTYQGVCLMLLWPMCLAPGESTSFGLRWRLG